MSKELETSIIKNAETFCFCMYAVSVLQVSFTLVFSSLTLIWKYRMSPNKFLQEKGFLLEIFQEVCVCVCICFNSFTGSHHLFTGSNFEVTQLHQNRCWLKDFELRGKTTVKPILSLGFSIFWIRLVRKSAMNILVCLCVCVFIQCTALAWRNDSQTVLALIHRRFLQQWKNEQESWLSRKQMLLS